MIELILRWIAAVLIAFCIGKVVSKLKLPAILGWLIAGMVLGPYAFNLLTDKLIDMVWYENIIHVLECAVGFMIGTELIWKKLKSYGKALIITTLAPALSIVQEFKTQGPVTKTLIPMAALDDMVGVAVFFTTVAIVARHISGNGMPLYMIPVMILLPLLIGFVTGLPAGKLLKKDRTKLQKIIADFNPILGVSMIVVILNLGAKATGMSSTVQKYLGFTLLPHSGVSLVFTGIAVSVLAVPSPECADIIKGTIAAAAVINEIIAVIAAKKGFEWAGEMSDIVN